MRISGWSSDVCSADLDGRTEFARATVEPGVGHLRKRRPPATGRRVDRVLGQPHTPPPLKTPLVICSSAPPPGFEPELSEPKSDRKSDVWGKSVSVRVALGVRRITKKKKQPDDN